MSHSWFVSPAGNDASAGTLAQPFRTIQRAASLAGLEGPVGGLVLNSPEELPHSWLLLRRRSLEVDKSRLALGQEPFVLQARDIHVGRHPAVALPVNPDEHGALLEIGAVEGPRRVRPRPLLEHHRRQVQALDRFSGRRALGGQLRERRGNEHPQALVRRSDGNGGFLS